MFTISAMKGDLEDIHAELVIQAAKPLYLHQFGQFRWIPKHTNKGSLQSAMYKLQDKFAWAQLHIVKLKDRPSLPCKTVTYGISWKESKTHEKKKMKKTKVHENAENVQMTRLLQQSSQKVSHPAMPLYCRTAVRIIK